MALSGEGFRILSHIFYRGVLQWEQVDDAINHLQTDLAS